MLVEIIFDLEYDDVSDIVRLAVVRTSTNLIIINSPTAHVSPVYPGSQAHWKEPRPGWEHWPPF